MSYPTFTQKIQVNDDTSFDVKALWDKDADVYSCHSSDIPGLHFEVDSLDKLESIAIELYKSLLLD